MFEINVIKISKTYIKVKENPISKFDVNDNITYLKGKEYPTYILKYELEYKGGEPKIGVYDTTFNTITFYDYTEAFKVDGIEYKLIYIYECMRVR